MNAAHCEIGEWHDRHRKEYAMFRAMIDNADNGDYDIYYKIFEMAAEFIPQNVLWQCESLFEGNNKQNADKDDGKAIAMKTVQTNNCRTHSSIVPWKNIRERSLIWTEQAECINICSTIVI